MSEVVIQFVQGSDAGGRRIDLDDEQLAGAICVVCRQAGPTEDLGYVAGERGPKLHTWCIRRWQERNF